MSLTPKENYLLFFLLLSNLKGQFHLIKILSDLTTAKSQVGAFLPGIFWNYSIW